MNAQPVIPQPTALTWNLHEAKVTTGATGLTLFQWRVTPPKGAYLMAANVGFVQPGGGTITSIALIVGATRVRPDTMNSPTAMELSFDSGSVTVGSSSSRSCSMSGVPVYFDGKQEIAVIGMCTAGTIGAELVSRGTFMLFPASLPGNVFETQPGKPTAV